VIVETRGFFMNRDGDDVPTTILDASGLRCPLPVLRARKAMKGVAAGEFLEVRSTDPSAVADFKSFCETTGDELVEWREADGIFLFRIRKAG
jgi:tRNA 2-thiouridine synthesizing protein A